MRFADIIWTVQHCGLLQENRVPVWPTTEHKLYIESLSRVLNHVDRKDGTLCPLKEAPDEILPTMKGLHNKPTAASDAKKSESVDSIPKILKRVPTDMGLGTDMGFGADMGEMGASGLQGADVTAELMEFFQVQL